MQDATNVATASATTRPAAEPRAADPARVTGGRKGLDAPVVWRRPSTSSAKSGADLCFTDVSYLDVTEIRSDYNWLYVDLVHKMAGLKLLDHPAAAPTVTMLLDGCPATAPPVSGAVLRDDPSPSTLIIGLSNLPDGEIDLMLVAHGNQAHVPLKKNGKTIGYLTTQQRSGYREFGPDPVTGERGATVLEPDCTGRRAP